MSLKYLLILIISYFSLGCDKPTNFNESNSLNASQPTTVLYIWGGEDEEDYLGKLNASRYDAESIWNEYGKYGSKYNSKSIWNEYGTYGSDYSQYSPFNDYAAHPPVLRDRHGKFYGYFTSNRYKSKRANYGLIDVICENYESIREDVSEWYDKIF